VGKRDERVAQKSLAELGNEAEIPQADSAGACGTRACSRRQIRHKAHGASGNEGLREAGRKAAALLRLFWTGRAAPRRAARARLQERERERERFPFAGAKAKAEEPPGESERAAASTLLAAKTMALNLAECRGEELKSACV